MSQKLYNFCDKKLLTGRMEELTKEKGMITIRENTMRVDVSELPARMDEVLTASRDHKVIIEKKHKPYAVIINVQKFEQIENQLDSFEDLLLGILAKERERGGKSSDYIDIETVLDYLNRTHYI